MQPGDRIEFWSDEDGGVWKPGIVAVPSTWDYWAGRAGTNVYIRIDVGNGVFIYRSKDKCKMAQPLTLKNQRLPIDVIPGSNPPRFVWTGKVNQLTSHGVDHVEQEGHLPASVEAAVLDLIALAKRLQKENMVFRGTINMTVDRLGGLVEGKPTHEGNFLQRVDELVAKESDRLPMPAEPATTEKPAPKLPVQATKKPR